LIALATLLLPTLIETLLAALIPSGSNIFNTNSNATIVGVQDLQLTHYGKQTVPFYVKAAENYDNNYMQQLVNEIYNSTNRPGVTLLRLPNNTVNDYVLSERVSKWENYIFDYFGGFKIDMTNQFEPEMTIYWSSLAYHSPGIMLSEIDNLLLRYMTSDANMSITTYNAPLTSFDTYTITTNSLQDVLACLDTLPLSLINFFNGLIIALLVSLVAIHVAKERINGSKQLQMLSGTHYGTYWFSNFLFDWPIFLLTIVSLLAVLSVVNSIRNNPAIELYPIAQSSNLGYLFLLLLFSSFSWCTYAYVWSFFFKSDVVSFIALFLLMSNAAFFYDVLTFFQVLFVDFSNKANFGSGFIALLRFLLVVLFPNVTIMRGMYDLKIRKNKFCIDAVNKALADNFALSDYALTFQEPGIGAFLLLTLVQFIASFLILLFLEIRIVQRIKTKISNRKKREVITEDEAAQYVSDICILLLFNHLFYSFIQ
jgi:hypothetical protein